MPCLVILILITDEALSRTAAAKCSTLFHILLSISPAVGRAFNSSPLKSTTMLRGSRIGAISRGLFRRQLSSASTRLLSAPSNTDVMAISELHSRFGDLANDDGVFTLFDKKQQESFSKRAERSSQDRQAAVLVLLCNVEGHVSVVFTRRASHLNQHAAEISFPGGHLEENESHAEAALRETCEELLPPKGFLDDVDIIGYASKLPSIRGTPVTPVLAVSSTEIRDVSAIFPGNPDEVDVVFSASIADLVKSEGSHVLPSNDFNLKQAPTFETPHGTIWGLTAYFLRPLLHRLLKPVYLEGTVVELDTRQSIL